MRCFCCLFKNSLIEVLSTFSKLHLFEMYILISFDVSVFLWNHLHSQAYEHIPHPQKSLCSLTSFPSNFSPLRLQETLICFLTLPVCWSFQEFYIYKIIQFQFFFCLTSFIIIDLRFICVECISSSLVLFVSWMLNQPCVTR